MTAAVTEEKKVDGREEGWDECIKAYTLNIIESQLNWHCI